MPYLLSILLLFASPLTYATVSDFEYIEALWKSSKEQAPMNFERIKEFFQVNSEFTTHCYRSSYIEPVPKGLEVFLEARQALERPTTIDLLQQKLGFDLMIAFEILDEPTGFFDYSEMLYCEIEENGCRSFEIQREWSPLLEEGEDEEKQLFSENWVFVLHPEGKLLAKVMIEGQAKQTNFLGAPSENLVYSLDYNCFLEPQ